jgi:hypothetical protein
VEELLGQMWRDLAAHWQSAWRFTSLWGPSVDLPTWLAPAAALGALLALLLTAGVAVLSLGLLLTSLLTAHLLLENVFGVSVRLAPRY